MSGARAVGGIRKTTGRKGNRPFNDPNLTREEMSALRAAIADISRRKREKPTKVRKKDWGTKSGRARPLAWRSAFLKVYARTGSIKQAAAAAGVKYQTARINISRDLLIREEAERMRAEWLIRQIRNGVRHGTRLEMSPRRLAALVGLLQKGGVE